MYVFFIEANKMWKVLYYSFAATVVSGRRKCRLSVSSAHNERVLPAWSRRAVPGFHWWSQLYATGATIQNYRAWSVLYDDINIYNKCIMTVIYSLAICLHYAIVGHFSPWKYSVHHDGSRLWPLVGFGSLRSNVSIFGELDTWKSVQMVKERKYDQDIILCLSLFKHTCQSTSKPAQQTAVSDQCHSTTCLLCMKVRAHNATTPQPSLVADAWVNRVQTHYARLSLSDYTKLVNEVWRVVDIDARRRLHFASTSALVTTSLRRLTIGDRAFFAAALHVWNSLPSSVTASETLGTFRHWLKTRLFTLSLS